MRLWPLAALMSLALLAPAGSPEAGPSRSAGVPETHVIQVTESALLIDGEPQNPADLRIRKDDVIRWEWVSGSHVILSGEPSDLDSGKIFEIRVDKDHTGEEHTFTATGVFKYFVEGHAETMHGTITVQAATSVNTATWGKIKSLFENP